MYLQLALDTRTKNVDLAPDTLRDHPFNMYACILESRNIPFAGMQQFNPLLRDVVKWSDTH